MSQRLKIKRLKVRRVWIRKPIERVHSPLKYERSKFKEETRRILKVN
jgi:hypothetical protein